MSLPTGPIAPALVVHQEGVVALVAMVAMAAGEAGPIAALSPRGGLGAAVLVGVAAGVGLAGATWALRRLPPVAELERWQRELVGEWPTVDAIAVAVLSGAAEEALFRAVLQPLVGLWAAAGLFAVLHVGPSRRLWAWPVLALAMGLAFGVVYSRVGYPGCAAAHVAVNLVGLLRLRGPRGVGAGNGAGDRVRFG